MGPDKPHADPAPPDWRYRALIALLAPLLTGHSLWQALRHRDARMARQKLGRGQRRRNDRPLWIHMSSVGEVNAAQALVAELRRRHPELPILATTFTPNGARTATARLGPGVEHVYLPLDFACAVSAFLDAVRPRCAVVVETEIWPELFHQCRRRRVPLLIVNGRLSERTLRRADWVREGYRRALQNADRVLARSELDAQRFIELGMPQDRVTVMGNIKFAPAARTVRPIALPRPYVVAASTHEDEELQLGRAWLDSTLARGHLLVMVPRHPERGRAILGQLRPLDPELAARSDRREPGAAARLYLADTLGELQDFIAGAELVCMGGSLVPRGGQNPIEAARLGKVTLFGPHMENFAEERALLLEHGAAVEAKSAEEMIGTAAELLADRQRLAAMGARAQAALVAREDVAERYADALEPYLSR